MAITVEDHMRISRAFARFQRYQVPVVRARARIRLHHRKDSVLHAIEGSCGLWGELARRLGITLVTAHRVLHQEGWESVKQAFEEEKLKALDQVVKRVFSVATSSTNDSASTNAARVLLEALHPDFHPQSRVTVAGDPTAPLNVRHVMLQIPAEVLGLPPEDQLRVLEVADGVEEGAAGES